MTLHLNLEDAGSCQSLIATQSDMGSSFDTGRRAIYFMRCLLTEQLRSTSESSAGIYMIT